MFFLFTFCIVLSASAQDEDLFPGGTYDPEIPTPRKILGHRFGALHTFHWEMERFLEAVDGASGRVEVRSYGKTYQNRKLYTVIISDPSNMARLEEIRKTNLRLTDPRSITESEVEEIAASMPSIVWLGYNIHGNEASAMEAAIRTIYQLAAGTDQTTMNILKNIVCIIDPVQNPDGHDRFVHGVRSVVTLKSHPKPEDAEHARSWPGGRTNHYLFDLNRDFFLKTQIESQARARVYHEWMPHVFADLHEMGSNATYFFSPPMPPYNAFVIPELMKWWNLIADANARAFDQFGWGYYTKESFDSFYPGYGTSYPSINGAVGMTYEQASARGVSIERRDGTILTLREAAWHHFTTSMATLRIVAERRTERIRDFHAFFVTALDQARKDTMKEILLDPRNDPQIAAKLVRNLLSEGVEILRAEQSFSNPGATSYLTKQTRSMRFPRGTYLIRLNQPQKILIKTLLAPENPLDDDFIAEQRKRLENRERTQFYDVTAWSMPLTYGIDAYWSTVPSRVDAPQVSNVPDFSGSVPNAPAHQAYLIPFGTLAASKLLIRLQADGFRVRIARKPFTLAGTDWPEGTLVVRVNRNPDTLHERVETLAETFGVNITAVHHGLAEAGIDLASNSIEPLLEPRIALLTDSPVSTYGYGVIHYLFERVFKLNFTRLNGRDATDLNDYNLLIMPSGNYDGVFSGSKLRMLQNWIRAGGTVIALDGAAAWIQKDTLRLSEATLLNDEDDPDDPEKKIRIKQTPGAICRINLDERSFLSYGCPANLAVLVRSDRIFLPFKEETRRNVGRFVFGESLRLSGFIWPETEKHLAGKGYLFVESYGRGKLILFAEDPNFRASYDGLNKLFLNAILLGPSLR